MSRSYWVQPRLIKSSIIRYWQYRTRNIKTDYNVLRSIFLKVYVVRSLCILHAAYSHTIDRGHKTKQTVEIRR